MLRGAFFVGYCTVHVKIEVQSTFRSGDDDGDDGAVAIFCNYKAVN